MATEAQTNANRANAQKSTGPRTEEGKARSRRNATIHGMYSQAPQLPGEPLDFFQTMLETYQAELQPVGILEEDLVYRIACAKVRLIRARRAEEGYIVTNAIYNPISEQWDPDGKADKLAWSFRNDCTGYRVMDQVNRYLRQGQRDYDNCSRELRKLQAERRAEQPKPPQEVPAPAARPKSSETNPNWTPNPEVQSACPEPTDPKLTADPPGNIPNAN